jgi:hypothetical protein
MNLHANGALSLNRRRQLCERVVDEAWTVTKAAEVAEVSVRCARKWVGRYRVEGQLGLVYRSSAPLSIPHRTDEDRVQAIAALRHLRFTGPEIAETLGMALSTVSGILRGSEWASVPWCRATALPRRPWRSCSSSAALDRDWFGSSAHVRKSVRICQWQQSGHDAHTAPGCCRP